MPHRNKGVLHPHRSKNFEYLQNSGSGYYARITFSNEKEKEVWFDRYGNLLRLDLNGVTVQNITLSGRTKIIADEQNNNTTKVYDERENLVRLTHPDGSAAEYAYGVELANLTWKKDELGVVAEYVYDVSEINLKQVIEAKGTVAERITEYEYDSYGNPTTRASKNAVLGLDFFSGFGTSKNCLQFTVTGCRACLGSFLCS